jgi:DNA polymerase-3 subunit beta
VIPFLNECTDEFVTIESQLNSIVISCGKADIKVPSANPDEFPKMVIDAPDSVGTVDRDSFASMVRRTMFCTNPDSSRFALGGVLLLTEHDELLAVGTDGRRLSFVRDVCQGKLTGADSIVVPEKALKFLVKQTGDGEADLWCNGNSIFFRDESTTLAARLIEGRYPNWRQVIPSLSEHSHLTIPNPALFASAVKQAAIVASGETRRLRLTLGNGLLCLECNEPDSGESKVEMPIEFNEQAIACALDYKFLGEFLSHLDKDTHLIMHIRNGTLPVVFEAGLQQYVLMPMSIN